MASGDVIVAVNGFRCHGQPPRDILESISNASTDAQCISRFDSVVFGGSVRREMNVDGQPLTYVVLTLRRRILKEKLNFQISRRRDDSSLPSSPPQQTTSASGRSPTLDAPSPPKPTIPTTHNRIDPPQLQELSHKNSLVTTPPASNSPAKPSTSIVSITVSPSGSLGFVAARLADDVCGTHAP